MPTSTFLNLQPDKRQRLIDIAVEEFANNDFDNASITRIVARAGIAKGSIYQYFADKKDLFLYLLELSNQKRLEYIRGEPTPEASLPFWQLLRWQVGASTRAALAYPLLTRLYLRAVRSHVPFHDEMLAGMQTLALDHWRQLVQRGIAQGAVDPEIDPSLAAVLLNAAFSETGVYLMRQLDIDDTTLHELDVTRFQSPEVERIFDDLIRMLERGIGRH